MLKLYLLDWLNFGLRFLHVIAGIAWIGASFYFNWLENKLNRHAQREGISGNLWAIHGGGYYYLEKYKKYPDQQPQSLHWFKWEAYVTWISGFLLLVVTYYLNAQTFLLSGDGVARISPEHGVLLSFLGIVGAWLVYDVLCRSPLLKYPLCLFMTLLAFVPLLVYVYGLVFNPRAVYIQIGSMIGTIMAANVFFVIIPVQRELVRSCTKKEPISADLGLRGYTRSRHNNYFTLPVLLMMISAHHPGLYGTDYDPAVLTALFVIAVSIRHIFNLRGEKKSYVKTAVFTIILFLSLVFFLKPTLTHQSESTQNKVSFTQVRRIINKHCVSCHASNPQGNIFSQAPLGFMLDNDGLIRNGKELIYKNVVVNQSMPLGNLTKMTDEERKIIQLWFLEQ